MFARFFYLLRERGLDISLNEWMTLMEAMEKGLHRSSLNGFYELCRVVLIKSETDYDKFDQVFLEFFKDVPYRGELPEEVLEWLNHPADDLRRTLDELAARGFSEESMKDIMDLLEKRLKEQKEQHNGGNKWVGTQGYTAWGNSGWHPGGIRIGGEGQFRSAAIVAGERRFRDFRKDNKLDTRQFQMAFRRLRQLSANMDDPEKVLDVDGTIRDTGDNAGSLKLRYMNPRKNAIKVLLLMDSGGSMDYYSKLCSMLFQAATKSNNFKELHTYYFHNCIFEHVYSDPRMYTEDRVEVDWIIKNFDSSYKVIIVGDAAMSPYELLQKRYDWFSRNEQEPGIYFLRRLKDHFPYIVWLNPEKTPEYSDYWTQTHYLLAQEFKMFELTVDGLESSMKALMAKKL